MDFLKSYGSIIIAIITIIASLIFQWAVFGVRLMSVESAVTDLKSINIDLQRQVSDQKANYAKQDAKIDAIAENVSYIRSRVDAATK